MTCLTQYLLKCPNTRCDDQSTGRHPFKSDKAERLRLDGRNHHDVTLGHQRAQVGHLPCQMDTVAVRHLLEVCR